MKVIVASFPKCGTKTLHRALEIMGYEVYDFDQQLFQNMKEWKDIVTYGSDEDVLKKMYQNVDAVCDVPASFYWEELSQAFPDAKIILTMRSSEDEWYRSYENQIKMACQSTLFRLYLVLTPTGRKVKAIWDQMGHVVFSCPPQPYTKWLQNPNAQIQKRRYREHNDSVLHRAPNDKLLVMKLSDGWEPLCKFLGKKVPDVPFPHENVKGVLVKKSLFNLPLFKQTEKELRVIVSLFVICISIVCGICFMYIYQHFYQQPW